MSSNVQQPTQKDGASSKQQKRKNKKAKPTSCNEHAIVFIEETHDQVSFITRKKTMLANHK